LKDTKLEAGQNVIQAAVKDVSSILSAPLAPPTKWATLTDSGEDVVVAQWSGNSIGDDPIPVMLWDDSISDTLIFQCRVNQMKSPGLFAHVIDELFTWNTRRLYAARLWLRYPPQPGDSLIGDGESGSRGQFILGPEVVFSGFADGKKAYFGVSLVSYFDVFPPDMKLINERFPPLRQRIKHWTTEKLVAETKRSVRSAVLPDGTTQRNQLLVGEAVARDDLTVTMFEDLLTRGVGNNASIGHYIVPKVIRVAMEKARLGKFAAAIGPYLDRLPHPHGAWSEADAILNALSEQTDLDLEGQAIRLLEKRVSISGSLKYLQSHGRTVRALDAVASLDLDEFAEQRKAVLIAINARITTQQ
jgi:hypothetical protein